jgi:hypothetical protein
MGLTELLPHLIRNESALMEVAQLLNLKTNSGPRQ